MVDAHQTTGLTVLLGFPDLSQDQLPADLLRDPRGEKPLGRRTDGEAECQRRWLWAMFPPKKAAVGSAETCYQMPDLARGHTGNPRDLGG